MNYDQIEGEWINKNNNWDQYFLVIELLLIDSFVFVTSDFDIIIHSTSQWLRKICMYVVWFLDGMVINCITDVLQLKITIF